MKNITIIISLLGFMFSYSQTAQKEDYHRARIYYNSPQQLKQIESLGIPLDHGIHKKNTFFESDFLQSDIEKIELLGFTTDIVIEDLRSYYVNQNNPRHKDYVGNYQSKNASCSSSGTQDYITPSNFDVQNGNDYGGYYTYSEILQELDDMAAQYPNLITAKIELGPNGNPFLTEGQTNNATTPSIGNNPIYWLKISDNPNTSTEGEPEILYSAIHHAREPMSVQQLIFYMWYLLENYATDPLVQTIVNNTELYFVPVINPDGYLHNEFTNPQGGGFWRKNRKNGNGVDNNRNYNYHINGNSNNGSWGGPGASGNPNSEVYYGTGPFSEVENQAMKWFVEQHNFALALNNHTFGELIYYPFGYADVATPDDNVYQAITGQMTSQNGYTPLRDSPFSGDSDDFMYGTVGTHNKIFAMTPEIGTSFWPPASSIESVCKEMMFTNLLAAQLAGNYASISEQSPFFIESTSTNVNYTLKRLGLQNSANFTVTVTPISSNIVSVGSDNTHNNLAYLQEVNGSIQININNNTNLGEEVVYDIVVNNGLYDITERITRLFGQPNIVLNEMGDNTNNWNTNSWAETTEDFAPGSASSSITDSPNTNYSNNQNNTIILSNAIDLSGYTSAYLSYDTRWEIENNWDYVQIEVSTDNGVNWIPQCGKFTNTGVANQGSANGQPLYDGNQTEWVSELINLSDYLNQTILIRFQLVSDGAVNADGFYFDNLQIKTIEENLSNTDFDIDTFNVFPNPVSDRLYIQTQETNYNLKLYNLQGQLVFESNNNSGNTSIEYSKYADGFYVLNINDNSFSKNIKIIKN